MAKSRTFGTLLIVALLGLITVLITTPKKAKKSHVAKEERTKLFV